MAERPDDPKSLDLGTLIDPKKHRVEVKPRDTPDEIRSRLKITESEAEHQHRTEEAEDAHNRRINLIVHVFVMLVVAVAFGASVCIVFVKDPTTGLPDKAMGVITAIVAAGVGYMTGKGSK